MNYVKCVFFIKNKTACHTLMHIYIYIYLQDMWAYYVPCIWIVYCHICPMTYLPPHLIHVISKTEGIR